MCVSESGRREFATASHKRVRTAACSTARSKSSPDAPIDFKTTGGNAQRDRITEIGIRFWRNGVVVGEWQTLLNPEARISGFIERLTGISNAMVASAPRFETIADELERHLDGCIFVAHNARFDYGFIKSEFRRLGRLFSARVLCTVRLSRALYPEAERHNMDALIARHGLPAVERHRAMGDVTAMLAFFEHTLLEQGEDTVGATINRLLQRPSTPSNVPAEMLADLPAGPGVYRFYGDNDVLLYVGKSTNIRQRVAVNQHHVGALARLDGADFVEPLDQLGVGAGCGAEHRHHGLGHGWIAGPPSAVRRITCSTLADWSTIGVTRQATSENRPVRNTRIVFQGSFVHGPVLSALGKKTG